MSETDWIAVGEALPGPGKPVLVACGKHCLRAAHAPHLTLSCDDWGDFNDDGGDYDEATDTYYWPEGWYEWNHCEETHWLLDEAPTYWMPLPKTPVAA